MKQAWIALLGSLLAGSLATAQEIISAIPIEGGYLAESTETTSSSPRVYGQAEYLRWWLSDAPGTPALLTTGDPRTDAGAGILGGRTTRLLFGNRDFDGGHFNGGRFTAGVALGEGDLYGIEGSGFFLAKQIQNFAADARNTNGFLAVPFTGANGVNSRLLLANNGGGAANLVNPLVGNGSFTAAHETQFWGSEFVGKLHLASNETVRVNLLAGFSYRQLKETLSLGYIQPPVTSAPFITSGAIANDRFATTNDFWGTQLGAQVAYQYGNLSLDVTGKLGLGSHQQEVNVRGTSTFQGTRFVLNRANNFGVFAQPSNIGNRIRNEFAAIPELNLKLKYAVSENVRLFFGYDVMYWGEVVRPGNQIDPTINTVAVRGSDFVSELQATTPALGGRPAPLFNLVDFVAQGISFGFEVHY